MAQAVSAVETSRKERLVLVRVPAFVAEHWLKVAPECDAPLGVVQPQGGGHLMVNLLPQAEVQRPLRQARRVPGKLPARV